MADIIPIIVERDALARRVAELEAALDTLQQKVARVLVGTSGPSYLDPMGRRLWSEMEVARNVACAALASSGGTGAAPSREQAGRADSSASEREPLGLSSARERAEKWVQRASYPVDNDVDHPHRVLYEGAADSLADLIAAIRREAVETSQAERRVIEIANGLDALWSGGVRGGADFWDRFATLLAACRALAGDAPAERRSIDAQ